MTVIDFDAMNGRSGPGDDFRRGGEPHGPEPVPELPLQTVLRAAFPEVHPEARLQIDFMRTLRIPDDGRDWPLPAGLGRFPMCRIDDLERRAPRRWRADGGVAMPMYQSEAMWMMFRSPEGYPFAVKVLAGGIDAVSGEDWARGLRADPQNYVVVPRQPWLDGFCVAKGRIRQFVAQPLGRGETVEERLTGKARTGGLQLVVVPMKAEAWAKVRKERGMSSPPPGTYCAEVIPAYEMGLAAGGSMRQEIYADPYEPDVWDLDATRSCFVRIVQAQRWHDLTGHPVPHPPISKQHYIDSGIPWFGYFDADLDVLHAQDRLKQLDQTGGAGGSAAG